MTHGFLLAHWWFVQPLCSGVFSSIPFQEIAEDQKIGSHLPLHLSHWLTWSHPKFYQHQQLHYLRNLDFEYPTPWSISTFSKLIYSLCNFFFFFNLIESPNSMALTLSIIHQPLISLLLSLLKLISGLSLYPSLTDTFNFFASLSLHCFS